MNRVTFDYAFGAPHTLTLSRPSASDKMPVRVSEDGMAPGLIGGLPGSGGGAGLPDGGHHL